MGEARPIVGCAAILANGARCPWRARWWLSFGIGPRAYCGVHANAWADVGARRWALVIGDPDADQAIANAAVRDEIHREGWQ